VPNRLTDLHKFHTDTDEPAGYRPKACSDEDWTAHQIDLRPEYCSSEMPTYRDLTGEAGDTLFSRIMTNHGHVLYSLSCQTVIPSLTV